MKNKIISWIVVVVKFVPTIFMPQKSLEWMKKELEMMCIIKPSVYKRNRKQIRRLAKCEILTVNDLLNNGILDKLK
jgi:hypothetical protein